LIVDIASPM